MQLKETLEEISKTFSCTFSVNAEKLEETWVPYQIKKYEDY